MFGVPVPRFAPAPPVNQTEMLEAQVEHLIAAELPQKLCIGMAKFKDNAMALVVDFTYSVELAAIGLDTAWLVHYGISDRHLAEVGGVAIWTDPDKFTLFKGVAVPDGLCVIQGQLGPKYEGVAPCTVRQSHDPLEQLGVPKEGLTAFLYWGKPLPQNCNMDFPGAVAESGLVPCLCLSDEKLALISSYGNNAGPNFGSVSVSRGS